VCWFGIFAIAAGQAGNWKLAHSYALDSAATAGFLLFNFPPAGIFLGDVGPVPNGFLLATLGILGRVTKRVPLGFLSWFSRLL
jgi:UDP-GlcNAc:undecaprenyl-phosphate GlcNAc-1-phosphate transferase